MRLTEVEQILVRDVDLNDFVDNPSAKKTVQECAVSLCKLSNHHTEQSLASIWKVCTNSRNRFSLYQ